MRIGFDGKRAVQNFTGLGNYSRYVADILCHFYPENDYVLYAPKKRENKRMNLLTGQYRQLTLAYPATSFWKKLSSLWRVWGITSQLEKEGIELFHGLSNELPLNIHKSRIKSIVTIHDLIFFRIPPRCNIGFQPRQKRFHIIVPVPAAVSVHKCFRIQKIGVHQAGIEHPNPKRRLQVAFDRRNRPGHRWKYNAALAALLQIVLLCTPFHLAEEGAVR